MPKKKLLTQMSEVIRMKNYCISTEQTYIHWEKKFILFHNKKHPLEMGAKEVKQYLTYLATK